MSPTTNFDLLSKFTIPPNIPPNISLCSQMNNWSDNYVIFSRYLNGYLTSACVIGGTLGNVLSVQSVRLSNFEQNRGIGLAVAIMVLAVWDTFLLWFALIYYVIKNLLPRPPNEWVDLVTIVTPFFHALSQISNTASIWSVVMITIQRYMATRDPFRNTRLSLYMASAELREYGLEFC